jgi:hypothetical protein
MYQQNVPFELWLILSHNSPLILFPASAIHPRIVLRPPRVTTTPFNIPALLPCANRVSLDSSLLHDIALLAFQSCVLRTAGRLAAPCTKHEIRPLTHSGKSPICCMMLSCGSGSGSHSFGYRSGRMEFSFGDVLNHRTRKYFNDSNQTYCAP